ncbi:hypothetical protein NKI85_28380 [Mesorhizobium sp. M0571]
MPNFSGWNTSDNGKCRNLTCHHGTSCDYSTSIDCYAIEDDGVRADPDVIGYADTLPTLALGTNGSRCILEHMICRENRYVACDENVIANLDTAISLDTAEWINCYTTAEFYIATVRDQEGILSDNTSITDADCPFALKKIGWHARTY